MAQIVVGFTLLFCGPMLSIGFGTFQIRLLAALVGVILSLVAFVILLEGQ